MRYLLLIVLLISCNSPERIQKRAAKQYAKLEHKYPDYFKDSTYYTNQPIIKTVEHDSNIILPPETFTVSISSPCPPSNKIDTGYSKKGYATVIMAKGKIIVGCNLDSALGVIKELKTELTYQKVQIKTVTKMVAKPLSDLDITFMTTGKFFWGLLILIIIIIIGDKIFLKGNILTTVLQLLKNKL